MPRKKFDDIFIRFDTIPAVTDGHVAVAKTALAERRAGKNYIFHSRLHFVEIITMLITFNIVCLF